MKVFSLVSCIEFWHGKTCVPQMGEKTEVSWVCGADWNALSAAL